MKIFITILAVTALVIAKDVWKPKNSAEIKDIRKNCMANNRLTKETFNKIKHGNYPDEERVHKFVLCLTMGMDIFCTKEGYHADRVAKQFKIDLKRSEMLAIAEGCIDKNPQESSAHEWAFRGFKCLLGSKFHKWMIVSLKVKQVKKENATM